MKRIAHRVVLLVLSACASPPRAAAPAPELPIASAAMPASAIVFDSDRTGNFEIHRMDADGSNAQALTRDPAFDSWWGRISPDRRYILFYRTPKGVHDRDFTKTSLWVMTADGSRATLLRLPGADGWALQGHAEWSPDGEHLVMFGGSRSSPQIYVTGKNGGSPRQVTHRGGTNIDPSWAPDGRTIVFVGCPRRVCFRADYEIYSTSAFEGGEERRLTDDRLPDFDPYYSPDGTRLAWLTQTAETGPVGVWNIRLARADGTAVRWLTNDQNVNSKPEWSRRGDLIFFHRLEIGRHRGFSIFQIRADGTGLRELTPGHPGVNEYPSS